MDPKKLKTTKSKKRNLSSYQTLMKMRYSNKNVPWKRSGRAGNRFYPGDWCSCIDYFSEEQLAQIMVGEAHFCKKCQSPVFLDPFSFIDEPEYLSIYYGSNQNKWALINTWKLKYFVNYVKEKLNDWSPSSKSFSRARPIHRKSG